MKIEGLNESVDVRFEGRVCCVVGPWCMTLTLNLMKALDGQILKAKRPCSVEVHRLVAFDPC